MKLKLNLMTRSSLKLAVVLMSVWVLSACSETADTGIPVAIPAIRVQCTTNQCLGNANPRTAMVFTTSGCVAPDFGEVLRYVSESHTCNSGGCNFSTSSSGWVDQSGSSVATIPSGTYSVCACLDLDKSHLPFEGCDQNSSYGPVLVDANSSTLFLTGWN